MLCGMQPFIVLNIHLRPSGRPHNFIYLSRKGWSKAPPKGVIRACLQVGLLTEDQSRLAMVMVDDRNLTVHTYNEELAQRIFANLKEYAEFIAVWLEAMGSQ